MARETYTEDGHLRPDFEPASYSAAQLRGIFLQHGVPCPSNLKKAELVQLFETHIRPNVPAYAAARQVKSSAKGIRDLRTAGRKQVSTVPDSQGDDGDSELGDDMMDVDEPAPAPVRRGKAKAPAVTAKRTRLTRSRSASVMDSEDETSAPKQLKRPRATTSRARKTVEAQPPPEPVKDETEDAMPVDVPTTKKRTHEQSNLEMVAEASSSSPDRRRKSGSHRRSSDGVESGFSDYNPFQQDGSDRKKRRKSSLAASALPAPEPDVEMEDEPAVKISPPRPPTAVQRMKPRPSAPAAFPAPPTAGPSTLSSRKSMPALRDVLREEDYDVAAPPTAAPRAKPRPSAPVPQRLGGGMSSSVSMPAFKPYMAPVEKLRSPPEEYKEMVRRASSSHNLAPSPRPPAAAEARRRPGSPIVALAKRSPTTSAVAIRRAVPSTAVAAQKLSLGFLTLLLLSYLGFWRQERFDIGYCDSGTHTNARAIEKAASLGALAPSCLPCPAHGTCADGQLVSCDHDYVRQPSLLGLAGALPVADHCAPDTEKLVRVADQARRISGHLRKYRGMVECGYVPSAQPVARRHQESVEAWKVYGMTEEDLKKELIEGKEIKVPQAVAEQYFRLALEDLVEHHVVEQGVNANGHVMYASTSADLPAACRAKRAAYGYANDHKQGIGGLFSALFAILYFRNWLRQRREERESTAELVAIALEKLQEQMVFHYKDQALTPNGWIAPGQLRDQILAHEHSAARRARLWRNVEKVVVGNSNVRRQHAEYRGEPTDVWEWIGPLGLLESGENGTPGSAIRGPGSARRSSKGARVSFGGEAARNLYPTL